MRGDHQVQFLDRREQQVRLIRIVADLIGEIGLHFGETIVGKLKALRHRLSRLDEHLLLRGIGRIDGELPRCAEKAGHGVGQTIAAGRRREARIAHVRNRLAHGGFTAFVGGRFGFQGGRAGFLAHELAIQQDIAHLLDLDDIDADGSAAGGGNVAEDHALAGVRGIVHVGHIAAHRFNRARLRPQGGKPHAQYIVESVFSHDRERLADLLQRGGRDQLSGHAA